MKTTKVIINYAILVGLTCFAFSACGTTPAKFYVLSATEYVSDENSINNEIGIGIHNLNFTGYLERNQIVTKKNNNELIVDDFHRWAEPIEENFERVLLENLALLIPTDKIYLINVERTATNAYFITAEVTRFELGIHNTVVLDVRWRVTSNIDNEYMIDRRSVYEKQIGQTDYQVVVSALSELIGNFSEDIAAEIKSLHEKNN